MSSAQYTRLDDPVSEDTKTSPSNHVVSINNHNSNSTTVSSTSNRGAATTTKSASEVKPSSFAGRGFKVNPNSKQDRSLYKHEIDESVHDPQKNINRQPLTFRRLFQQAKPERPMIICATIALFLSALFNLAIPAFVGVIIDAIANANDPTVPTRANDMIDRFVRDLGFGDTPKALLNVSVIILAILITLAAIFSLIRGYLFSLAGERVVARLRNQLFTHIMHFEIAFFDITRTGELVNRLSSDTTILKDAVTSNVSMGLRWAATVLVGLGYLFFISWKLTLVMLSVVPVVAIAARFYGKSIRALSKQTQEALAHATETAEESISHIRTVRAFYREPLQISLYGEKIQHTYDLGATIALYYGIFLGGIGWIASAAMILVLWYGATLVIDGQLSTGVLTSYVLYTITVGTALAGLSGLFGSIMQAVGACDRVFELLDRNPAIPVNGGHVPPQLIGHVSFQKVTFSYPSRPQTNVLRDVSLELKPGTVTALVGQSGGGKSTCVSLIERFYDVAEGSGVITIDGRNIKSLDPSWLHEHIGLVSQEPVLFATTIRANLTYGGMLNVSDSDIDRACQMANAAEFINNFPDKYDTMVGERGIRLSGGQKQRVAIARAILMNPSILIADEATSSLDAESEYHVQTALDRLMHGRTVLVVAHRLSTVKNADNVIVIDGGRIVEQGTHTQLLARSGTYAKLVARQLTQSLPEPETPETVATSS